MALRDRLARQAEPKAVPQAETGDADESAKPSSTQWLSDFLTREGILVESPDPAEEAPRPAPKPAQLDPPRPRPVLLIGPPLAGPPRAELRPLPEPVLAARTRAEPRLALERSAAEPRSEPRLPSPPTSDSRPRVRPILLAAPPLTGKPESHTAAPAKPFLPDKRRHRRRYGRTRRWVRYWLILGVLAVLVAGALLVLGAPRAAKTVVVAPPSPPPVSLAMSRAVVNEPPAIQPPQPPQQPAGAPSSPPLAAPLSPAAPKPPAQRLRPAQGQPATSAHVTAAHGTAAPAPTTAAAGATPLHLKIVYSPPGAAQASKAAAVVDMLQSPLGPIAGSQTVPGWARHGLVIYYSASDREAAHRLAASLSRIMQQRESAVLAHVKSPPAPGTIEILLPLWHTPASLAAQKP